MTKRFTSQARKSVNVIRLFIGFALLASTLVLPVGVAQAAETVEPEAPGKMFPESHNVSKRQKFIAIDDPQIDGLHPKIEDKGLPCRTLDGGAALYQVIQKNGNYIATYDPALINLDSKGEPDGTVGGYTNKKYIDDVEGNLNALVVDPDGRFFASHNKTDGNHEFVQVFPDKGTFEVLSTELEANKNKNYNAGNYVEIDGQPFRYFQTDLETQYSKKLI